MYGIMPLRIGIKRPGTITPRGVITGPAAIIW